MLTQRFDYTIATFASLEEVKKEELKVADLVVISEYIREGIYHAKEMIWRGNISNVQNPYDLIRSKKEKIAIEENAQYFKDQGYEIKTVPMTEALFQEFFELYQNTTMKKPRVIRYNLQEQILSKILIHLPVYLIGLFRSNILESGLVFSVRENQILVSMGAKKKFSERRGGVGGVFEVELMRFCVENSISNISHGISENPAGINSAAGIFEFKARYGFSAFPTGSWQTTFVLNPEIIPSDLVFVTIGSIEHPLQQLVLSNTTENLEHKYQTKDVPFVTQKLLNTESAQHRAFLGV
jgi:hypothetical protein